MGDNRTYPRFLPNMADPTTVFSATAFGGGTDGIADYANTPICWIGTTAEPDLGGNGNSAYLDRWARGWSTLESAWAGRDNNSFLAVTDICLEP